ncbi:major pollen allergen Ole e 1 [Mangifera indica]|uniref:major pollen allergen Ole e 1 n=1 Tax=Mangifera indica TaxID=29780 RepID=UPI001CFACDA0|nr:major pollen allergen Ole e 1 [Mangifera indica]
MRKLLSYLSKSGTMNLMISFLVISILFIRTQSGEIRPRKNANAHITVMGFVYCDICSNNTFSRHSYFIPGAEVKIDCKFKASSPKTKEQISFSVNRTTNRHGVYRLDIPSVDGVACGETAIATTCEASLMWSSSDSCNVPGFRTTTDQIAIKSKQANLCIYSLNPLNFRPLKIDGSLCRN